MATPPPAEAAEFARMVVRAFYPAEYVVLLDAVLRSNNFIAHYLLAQKLGLQPKELRQMLTRMEQARLMRSDKRTQRRINRHDEKTRTVTTEFWYVPLGAVVDAFLFRVHHISTHISARVAREREQRKHICKRCATRYDLLDILSWEHQGEFFCEKMGVRPDRRPLPCGGIINEEDNSTEIKAMERLNHMMQDDLKELRERALKCAAMDLPNHPLANADDKTWAEVVPENVGVHGERVDPEGAAIDPPTDPTATASDTFPHQNSLADAAPQPIPDRPDWFNSSNPAENDDEGDYEQETILPSKQPNPTAFNTEDENAYRQRLLSEFAATDPTPTNPPTSASLPAASAQHPVSNPADPSADPADDTTVMVAGKPVKLSQVTDEMTETMTTDEYKVYFALAQSSGAGGPDDDDDDDEFN